MRTKFTDAEDKRLVVLALEYESQRKRVQWKEVTRAMRGKYSAQALESRLPPSQAERTICDVFSEVLPAAVSKIIEMIGNIRHDDVFFDVGAGLGNVAAQYAVQTKARQCLGIEKRPELAQQRFFLLQGNVDDTPLSTTPPFLDASVIFLNDFLFDELARLVVEEELSLLQRARLIISTSRYCPRHRESCRRRFCAKWVPTHTTYGHASWKSECIPIYMYQVRQQNCEPSPV
ncbi:histone methylation protein, putative [Phytophthora infestans T30-4]|uniref:Histone-lysine N-methyltransferase, H3 lysine-79 specific n=1 Tax=Phytophthora infestans (strain T30-4) TaxID=403677 RepID=D0NNU0_PHYIT|nr:histone methylation protein, putative [Phytophthora infestans T30-4]EEY62261.1 histone methylation protein, putative [Phytophthora infestans T30-4]|eukprot:XP_002899292.1 histone methylation protein, putative [Phytophthora infestans T30-4]